MNNHLTTNALPTLIKETVKWAEALPCGSVSELRALVSGVRSTYEICKQRVRLRDNAHRLVYILVHMDKPCARTLVTAPGQCNMAGLVPGNLSKSYLVDSTATNVTATSR